MDFSGILRTINWKTSACAVAYLICNIIAGLYPPISDVCGVLDKIFVAMGLATAADANRVQNIVQAVDHIFDQVRIDPATIPPAGVKTLTVTPAPVLPAFLLPLLLVGGLLTLSGCASYMQTEDGRYQRIKSAQEPMAIGVSNSYAMLETCKGTQAEGYHYEKLEFTDCHDLVHTRQHASAPGWFPQVFNGLMNLAGFGWVASAQGSGASASANSTSSSVSNAAATAIGGGKGGHH